MIKPPIYITILVFIFLTACTGFGERPEAMIEIPNFDFPQTVIFEQKLSAYQIFEGSYDELIPSNGFQLLELSSVLFTDYAYKQRLVKVPAGTSMTRLEDGKIDFPNGTILTKTFYYYQDERDTSLGKNIIETRLLIKEGGAWNVATYVWNQAQTDATLTLDGLDMQVSWINSNGNNLSTLYHVPTKDECGTCHQSKSSMTHLGPTLRNLNRMVTRNGINLNQIDHLQNLGLLSDFQPNLALQMVDYKNTNASLEDRGRAYLAMNCAHCHNPDGWDKSAERDFDFRYETPLNQTGIPFDNEKIVEAVIDREMPFIGTTMLDEEGVSLLLEFIESL